jgi:ketosteroid isomerase-like protein
MMATLTRSARATVLAVLATAGGCSYQDTIRLNPEVDREAIRQQIGAAIDATRTKDIEAYMAQIPEDIVLHDPDGNPMSRDQVREQVLAAWAQIQETRYIGADVDTIVVSGDSAVVHTTQTWDRLVLRPDTAVVDTVLSMTRQREFWRRTPEGWRAYEVRNLGGTTRVNGVLISRMPDG